MIVKIDIRFKEPLKRICAKLDYICRIYTIENAPLMVQADITWINSAGRVEDLTNKMAFYLCGSLMVECDIEDLTN